MAYTDTYRSWLESGALNDEELAELKSIENNDKEIESRFYGSLEFGTAGLRGTMGMGTARMNVYVIRLATQAFAETILEDPASSGKSVAICYDCRINSETFAREAASVMAGNGIPVRIFEAMRPTPELSFAIRHYNCAAGLNITASHNPKEYNGYKVYWSDGAQLPPAKADIIAGKMAKTDIFTGITKIPFDDGLSSGIITLMGSETDDAFMENVMAQANDYDTVARVADDFNMVYTPFHGTGYQLVPEALTRLDIKNIHCVKEQMVIDGTFPTVISPNPENPEGFYLAIDLAEKTGADFILGTDPDTDRVGIMVKGPDGKFVTISGNQTGVLLLDYLIGAKKRTGTMPENPVALKTIVTTEMARKVAEANGVTCFDTFTGFKFMAEKKNALEESGEGNVIFSYEESYGYMVGDFVRDKDAVTASLLLTEMAAWYFNRGMTLYDAMESLYEKYGWYSEKTLNLVLPGLDGAEKIRKIMADLRAAPPSEIGGTSVVIRREYRDGTELDLRTGKVTKMELFDSNVVSYILEDGTTVIVRPSGTEPKVKVYLLAAGTSKDECAKKVLDYSKWAEALKN